MERLGGHLTNFFVRKAIPSDLVDIKRIADGEKKSLGFITRGTIDEATRLEQIIVVEVSRKVVGFQHYNHRKRDLQTTLYHLAVDPEHRGLGLGKLLLDTVVAESKRMGRKVIKTKIPVGLPSNEFHNKYGFKQIGQEDGKRRKLNIWQLDLD